MNDVKLLCEDYDFSALAAAFCGEAECDCTLSAEIIFVDEEGIRELNARTRGIDKVTDVLSYPSLELVPHSPICAAEHPYDVDEDGCLFIGSVAICTKRAKEQAEEFGHSYERELNYLAAHGVCHLLGFDHMREDQKAEMREQEERVLSKLNLSRGKNGGGGAYA